MLEISLGGSTPIFEGQCTSKILQSAVSVDGAIVQQESYDIVATMETQWDDSHNWSAAMDGYKLFRRDRQGRRGGGVALCVRECFD